MSPVVFHPGYDIKFFGLERLHPFDSAKYGRIHKRLVAESGLTAAAVHRPEEATREQLLLVHDEAYLETLKQPATVAAITELGLLRSLPAGAIDKRLLRPKRLATGGTILAARLALEHGWAINLSGGYHHAKPGNGEGFCVYADIPVAAKLLWKEDPRLRLLVIDLDAHQGNGLAACFRDDPRVHLLDLYNADIYPRDNPVKQFIDTDLPIATGTGDAAYLRLLEAHLPKAFDAARPGLVFYNAGTDVFEADPLGGLRISGKAIAQRDARVFAEARKRGVPIVMLPSGGYTPESANLVADSILGLGLLPEKD